MYLIIPSSTPQLLRSCLASIDEHDPVFLSRTLVVTDDTDDFRPVMEEYPVVEFLQTYEEFNFSAWNNHALKVLLPRADSFMLLNDDCQLITPGGFTMLEKLVEQPGTPPILSAAIRGTGGVIDQRQHTPNSIRLMPGHISFTAVAIHKQVWEKLGSLDERFTGYGHEDNDYCQRAMAENIPIAVFDGCLVAHTKPHSTFGRRDDFMALWLQNETLFGEKWSEAQDTVIVIGGSRSGGAVLTAVVEKMGYVMPDPPAHFEKNVSVYYRDDRLAKAVKLGEWGVRNYIAGNDMAHAAPWGTRMWPQPDAAVKVLKQLEAFHSPRVLFANRSRRARINSYVMDRGVKHSEAVTRIDNEIEGERRIREWVTENDIPFMDVDYDDLVDFSHETIGQIADFLGYRKSVAEARAVIRPAFRTFDPFGDLVETPGPDDFGKVAIGVRLTHPEAGFVGCYARLLHDGLRDGDTVLEPTIRTPSHWAAGTLMRRFLASDADTLLLIDDDMTFPPDLLEKLRANKENHRYQIVSALATQRVPPPRALVLRVGEQPDLPDALNGLYYNLLVNEVVPGQTLPVDGTGFAFTLIRREVIERMTDPQWGAPFTSYVQWGAGGEGEDVNFCRRAGSLGFSVAVDCDAQVGHIGSVIYGYSEFDQWRDGQVGTGLRADRLIELVEAALPNLNGEQRSMAVAFLANAREQ